MTSFDMVGVLIIGLVTGSVATLVSRQAVPLLHNSYKQWKKKRDDHACEKLTVTLTIYQECLDVEKLLGRWVNPLEPTDPRNNKMMVVPPADLNVDDLPAGYVWMQVFPVDIDRLSKTHQELLEKRERMVKRRRWLP